MRNMLIFAFVLLGAGLYGQTQITNGMSGRNVRNALNSNFDTLFVSNTHRVSEARGYTTIQGAITDASANDVIYIYPGDYASIYLNKAVTLIADGRVTAKRLHITSSDTSKVKGVKLIPDAAVDTMLYINSTGIVNMSDVEVENSTTDSKIFIVDAGTVYGDNVNFRNNGSVKFIINGGTVNLNGEYLYSYSPYIYGGANVYLDYDRLGSGIHVWGSASLQGNFRVFKNFTSTYADTLGSTNFHIRESASLILQCDNLNGGVYLHGSNEVKINNSYGDEGRIYLTNQGAGKYFINNCFFLYRSDDSSSHIIETAPYTTGSMTISNSTFIFRAGFDGTIGNGSPMWWVGGDYYGYNNVWIDYNTPSDTLSYQRWGGIQGDFTMEIDGSKFIYKSDDPNYDVMSIGANDSTDLRIKVTNCTFDVPDVVFHMAGRGVLESDTILLNNNTLLNANSSLQGPVFSGGFWRALQPDVVKSYYTNPTFYGRNIKYSPIGPYNQRYGYDSFLSWNSDTVRMAKAGDAGDTIIVTFDIANNYDYNFSAADIKLYVGNTADASIWAAVYDITYNQFSNAGRIWVTYIMG
jgi:hypothetical protein